MPHLWIKGNISTLDLLGKGFVLVTGEDDDGWKKAAMSFGNITVHSIRALRKKLGVNADGGILVRPDGFVTWRSKRLTKNPVTSLEEALKKLFIQS